MGHSQSSVAMAWRVFAFGLALILVVSAVALVFFVGNSTTSNSSTSSEQQPPFVTVFGLASTVGQGTHMVAMGFTNTKTGENFTAPISDGNFSVSLPNGAVYHVAARWAGNYSWQAGVDDRGGLTVNMSAGSMTVMSYNIQLQTPPTIVAVHGAILWTIPSAHPVSIIYTASDGESFEAPVQNATFSTRLPNMMDYQVKVFWQYQDGSTDYLFAANQTVNEGTGVAGLDFTVG
jgi:hypothetical protein